MIGEADIVENVMELGAILDLIDLNFFISEHQRGYRRESTQANQLLDDVPESFAKNQHYN